MIEDQIRHMVDRFLNWKLPSNFRPDAGISYTRPNWPASWPGPMGTNLLDATQADAMVRHMVDGMSDGWRPIETAPRDGTPFLCFTPDDEFSSQTGIDLIWYEPAIKTYTQDGDNEVPFAGITHWRPLPSAPTRP